MKTDNIDVPESTARVGTDLQSFQRGGVGDVLVVGQRGGKADEPCAPHAANLARGTTWKLGRIRRVTQRASSKAVRRARFVWLVFVLLRVVKSRFSGVATLLSVSEICCFFVCVSPVSPSTLILYKVSPEPKSPTIPGPVPS